MRPGGAIVLCVLLVGCVGPAVSPTATTSQGSPPESTGLTTATSERIGSIRAAGNAAVIIADANGNHLATVNATVADEPAERVQGLSDVTHLPNGSGMLFVYDREAPRTFVMRDMAIPIDMIFIDANGTIVAIYHAPVEHDDNLTEYTAPAQWVLEVPSHWTTRNEVEVGNSFEIVRSRNATG